MCVIPSGTGIIPRRPTLNATLTAVPPPPYQASGCTGAHVAVSFTFNGSGSVAVAIHGDSAYWIAVDEVCEAVLPLAALDSCAPSDSYGTAAHSRRDYGCAKRRSQDPVLPLSPRQRVRRARCSVR